MQKKSFGQHFLKDEAVIDQIILACDIRPNELVVEVGPGGGALTDRLIVTRNPLVLIEADRDLIPKLAFKYPSATIIQSDAAQVDYDKITEGKPWMFVSNLPYNAGNAILEQVHRSRLAPRALVIMVQKEVGDRMMAAPGEMSVLSVATQLYCSVERVCLVPPAAFVPPPQVDSVVLRLVPRTDRIENIEAVIALAKIGFAHRRKQLRQTLASSNVASLEIIDAAFEKLSLGRMVRPQELSIEQWISLQSIVC